MTQQNLNLSRDRSEWVSLRTLIVLRWIAIIGQVGAVVVADQVLGLQFKVELCYFVVGLALVFNIIVSFLFPQNKRPEQVPTGQL